MRNNLGKQIKKLFHALCTNKNTVEVSRKSVYVKFFNCTKNYNVSTNRKNKHVKLGHTTTHSICRPVVRSAREDRYLLGAEIFYDVLRTGQYKPIINGPMFQETVFGWIIAGPAKSENNCTVHSFFLNVTPARPSCFDLNDKITKFWELEEVPKEIVYSSEEKMCVDHFNKSVKRNGEGRFVVRLPLRENINTLGASRSIALKRFLSLEKRFRSNPKLKQKYVEFMEEYVNLGHMERVNPGEKEEKLYIFYIIRRCLLSSKSLLL